MILGDRVELPLADPWNFGVGLGGYDCGDIWDFWEGVGIGVIVGGASGGTIDIGGALLFGLRGDLGLGDEVLF